MFWQASDKARRQQPRGEASLREQIRLMCVSAHAHHDIPPEWRRD
jgi:hypothetical protein